MKPFLYVFFLSLLCFSLPAQTLPEWKKGVIVLANRSVLTGEISCHPSYDVVLLRSNDELTVFPAHKLQSFRFYDESADVNRHYVCLRPDDRPARFFEVVVHGPVNVLRRGKGLSLTSSHDEIDGYHYFSWDGRALEPLSKFHSKLYPQLIADQPLLPAFVDNGHLKIHEMKSAILIIKEYNRITQKSLVALAY